MPMPNSRPCLRASACCFAKLLVAGGLGGGVEAFDESGLVPDDPGSDPVRKFLGSNQVAAPDLERIEAERLRAHIHQPLGDEGRNRSADAAIGSGRRLAGRDAAHGAAIGSDLVRTRKEADDLDRLQAAGPGIDRIGADVADDVGLQRGRDAVRHRTPSRHRRSRRKPDCCC